MWSLCGKLFGLVSMHIALTKPKSTFRGLKKNFWGLRASHLVIFLTLCKFTFENSLEHLFGGEGGNQFLENSYCLCMYVYIILQYNKIESSSIWIRFPTPPPAPTPPPHFFSQHPVSVYIFWNNGQILMFKVSKRPYWCARHDGIIFRWRDNPPGGEKLN